MSHTPQHTNVFQKNTSLEVLIMFHYIFSYSIGKSDTVQASDRKDYLGITYESPRLTTQLSVSCPSPSLLRSLKYVATCGKIYEISLSKLHASLNLRIIWVLKISYMDMWAHKIKTMRICLHGYESKYFNQEGRACDWTPSLNDMHLTMCPISTNFFTLSHSAPPSEYQAYLKLKI